MRSWTDRDYNGLIDIPEGQVENFAIRHKVRPAGEILRTSNMRTAMFGGHDTEEVEYGYETRWHELTEEGGVWMTDDPIEQAQHRTLLEPVEGSVLVGGLGLGVSATMLANDPAVTQVTVVENSREVIDLVHPHLIVPDGKLHVVHSDLFRYVADPRDCFDWAYYDIWQSDGEGTFFNTVVPLVEESVRSGVVSDQSSVICWNEDIMRGQLALSLRNRLMMKAAYEASQQGQEHAAQILIKDFDPRDLVKTRGDIYHDWAVDFFRYIEEDDPRPDKIDERLQTYASVYGRPGWEGAFYSGMWD